MPIRHLGKCSIKWSWMPNDKAAVYAALECARGVPIVAMGTDVFMTLQLS
jgi:hypothetical protein